MRTSILRRGSFQRSGQQAGSLPKPIFEKTLKPIFTQHCSITFPRIHERFNLLLQKTPSALQHSESPSTFIVFLIIKRYLLSFFCWSFLHFNRFASSCNCPVHTLWVAFPFLLLRNLGLRQSSQRTYVRSFFTFLP